MFSWIRSASMQMKLIVMFAGGLVGFLVFFLVTILISSSNQSRMSALVETQLPIIEISGRLSGKINAARVQIVQNSLSKKAEGFTALAAIHGSVRADFERLIQIDQSDSEQLNALQAEYDSAYQKSETLLHQVIDTSERTESATAKFQELSASLQRIEQKVIDIKRAQENALRASVEGTKSASRTAVWSGVFLLALVFPFSFVFFRMLRSIDGHLTQASDRLRDASEKILSISEKAQVSSHQLAISSSEQASSVLESVASMDQMKQMLNQTVTHSDKALGASEASFLEAQSGKTVVDNMRVAMVDIERSYDELEDVNALMREIRMKTAVINDIVFKTQLLSFNASIEAARAGRHGLGFAVVAAEVGKLAEMSGEAADLIERMLEDSAHKVAETINRTKQKVDIANSLSQQCSEVFDRITERTAQTKEVVVFITQAAGEQQTGITNVGQVMQELNDGAGDTDRMAQAIARLSSQLKNESGVLADTVGDLNRLIHGGDGESYEIHSLDYDQGDADSSGENQAA